MLTTTKYNKLLCITPVYICDQTVVEKKLNELKRILTKEYPNFKIAYSFKTNYSFAKSKQIKSFSLLAEVVSENEFKMAKKNKFKNFDIIFNGPNKNNTILTKLINSGVNVNIDNFSEIKSLDETKIKKTVGIRVSTNIKGLSPSRFGFNIENGNAIKALKLLNKKSIKVNTIHCHIGTNINSLFAYKKMAQNVSKFITSIEKYGNTTIKNIDLGGGFPSNSLLPLGYEQNKISIEDIIKTITKELKKNLNSKEFPTLIFEPGRYLVDDATYLFTKVIDSKVENHRQTLIIDTTVNSMPSVWYKPQKIKVIHNRQVKKAKISTTIYGSSCQENDVIFTGDFPNCITNDILVFYSMGAYNASLASDFIFGKPTEIVI